jgi:queuine tRNA-ribosyltransferase
MVGAILLSEHNIAYLLNLMHTARAAIVAGSYGDFMQRFESLPASNDW